MRTGSKLLTVSLLMTIAALAVAIGSAGAETGGHFTSDAEHTFVQGVEGGSHDTKLSIDGGTPIDCTKVTDSGTTTTSTATEVTIVPTFLECGTEGAGHNMTVDMNGCHYLVRIGKSAGGHNTIQFVCPTGFSARLTHPNCTIAIPAQTPSGGLSYTTTTENGKHALTVDVTVSGITAHYEGGICVFLGTSHSATINGSVTIAGLNTAGSPVNITATGSSGS